MKFEFDNERKIIVNGTERAYDLDALKNEVLAHIMYYGLRQVMNDSHASALANVCPLDEKEFETKAEFTKARKQWGIDNPGAVNEERERLIDEKWSRLVAGELRVSSGKARLSEFEKKVYEVAREWLKAAMRAQGLEMGRFTKLEKDEQFEILDQYMSADNRRADVEAEAQSRIDKAKAANVDIGSVLA